MYRTESHLNIFSCRWSTSYNMGCHLTTSADHSLQKQHVDFQLESVVWMSQVWTVQPEVTEANSRECAPVAFISTTCDQTTRFWWKIWFRLSRLIGQAAPPNRGRRGHDLLSGPQAFSQFGARMIGGAVKIDDHSSRHVHQLLLRSTFKSGLFSRQRHFFLFFFF